MKVLCHSVCVCCSSLVLPQGQHLLTERGHGGQTPLWHLTSQVWFPQERMAPQSWKTHKDTHTTGEMSKCFKIKQNRTEHTVTCWQFHCGLAHGLSVFSLPHTHGWALTLGQGEHSDTHTHINPQRQTGENWSYMHNDLELNRCACLLCVFTFVTGLCAHVLSTWQQLATLLPTWPLLSERQTEKVTDAIKDSQWLECMCVQWCLPCCYSDGGGA